MVFRGNGPERRHWGEIVTTSAAYQKEAIKFSNEAIRLLHDDIEFGHEKNACLERLRDDIFYAIRRFDKVGHGSNNFGQTNWHHESALIDALISIHKFASVASKRRKSLLRKEDAEWLSQATEHALKSQEEPSGRRMRSEIESKRNQLRSQLSQDDNFVK